MLEKENQKFFRNAIVMKNTKCHKREQMSYGYSILYYMVYAILRIWIVRP